MRFVTIAPERFHNLGVVDISDWDKFPSTQRDISIKAYPSCACDHSFASRERSAALREVGLEMASDFRATVGEN